MKLLTLWQPWASAIALGLKHYETRSWTVDYQGWLAIHAAKKPMTKDIIQLFKKEYSAHELLLETAQQSLGCIVAICYLNNCIKMDSQLISTQPKLELLFGDWKIGRYAWELKHIRAIAPVPCQGGQRLKDVPTEVIKQINISIDPFTPTMTANSRKIERKRGSPYPQRSGVGKDSAAM